jgi:carboxypeptidase D
MDGAMMEIGPYRVKAGGNLEYNNGSWDEFANVLFVDQPVGTGFSYVNTNAYINELDQMTNHMVLFLEKFYNLFPEYEHDDVSIPFAYIYVLVLTMCRSILLANLMLANTFHISHAVS